MVDNDNRLVYPLPDSTEAIIGRTIEEIQRMISPYQGEDGETTGEAVIEI